MSRASLPGSIVPAVASSPSARAPTRVALSSSIAAGTDGRQASQRGQLGKQVQVVVARQAVGPHRHGDAGPVEPPDRRVADADVAVASRTRDHRRAPRPQHVEVVVAALHGVHGQQPGIEHAHLLQIPDRRTGRGRPAWIPRPEPLQQLTPGARPPCRATRLPPGDSARWTDDGRNGVRACAARSPWNSCGDTEYGACGARLTGKPSRRPVRFLRAQRRLEHIVGAIGSRVATLRERRRRQACCGAARRR